MSPLPSATPATRFVIFSDETNRVRVYDETILTRLGSAFTSFWLSPTLNRDARGQAMLTEHTLCRFLFHYQAESASNVQVLASGDGGETFNETKGLSLAATAGRLGRAFLGFNTTGFDLKVKIEFTTSVLINFTGHGLKIVERTEVLQS